MGEGEGMSELPGQMDFDLLTAKTEKENRIWSRSELEDRIVVEDTDELRKYALKWALDFDWHMAYHECPGLIAEQARMRIVNPDYKKHPVVYCNCFQSFREKDVDHWTIRKNSHSEIDLCPYCGVDLVGGKGQIILERRIDGKHYQAVYERNWEATT